jgi:hypothetical protein
VAAIALPSLANPTTLTPWRVRTGGTGGLGATRHTPQGAERPTLPPASRLRGERVAGKTGIVAGAGTAGGDRMEIIEVPG